MVTGIFTGFMRINIKFGVIFFFLSGMTFLWGNNGLLIGLHYNNNNFKKTELGITDNLNRELSVTTGQTVYGTSDNTPSSGAVTLYTWGWDNGNGTKAWVLPMTTSGFENLTLSFYQKSRAQLVGSWEYGPRDFKLQYSINGSSWNDISGAAFSLTSSWQKFEVTLPAGCENQSVLYLRWIMTSNVSINGGSIASGALSDFADMYIYADEIPLPVTDLSLSNNIISSSRPAGTAIGKFSHVDANIWDTFTYSLTAGSGDNNNSSFTIENDSLKTAETLSPGTYHIRVNVNDGVYDFSKSLEIISSLYESLNGGYNEWDYITNVTFNTINNSSGTDTDCYGNYTHISTEINAGESYDLSVSNGEEIDPGYPQYLKAWIDWNGNGSFEDEGESYEIESNITEQNTFTISITVPFSATADSTRLRIALRSPNGVPEDPEFFAPSAGSFDYGEAEDYTVVVSGALPVELLSFSAASTSSAAVELKWETATEVNNYGFEIERTSPLPSPYQGEGGAAGRGWEKVGFVEGAGNSNSVKSYSFKDLNLTLNPNLTLVYRLKQIDLDGKLTYSKEIEVSVENLPTEFALEQNYPNPFNPATTIKYSLPEVQTLHATSVQLKIYNLLGQEVATLVNEQQSAGNYEVKFDASNLSSGIYMYKLEAGNYLSVKKMILMK